MEWTYCFIWFLCLSVSECQQPPDSESVLGEVQSPLIPRGFNSRAGYHVIISIPCGEPEPLLNGGVTLVSGFQNELGSVVQYHCNEPFYTLPGGINVNFTCEADGKWRSNDSHVPPTCMPVCGRPTKLISTYQRIMGGSVAPDDTIPWQVQLSLMQFRGGGMVIADRWILTAAQLVTSYGKALNDTLRVYIGQSYVDSQTDSPVFFAASVHSHPDYKSNHLFSNDIALIKLQDPITFNSSVMPICLPAEGATYTTGLMGMVSGFGYMSKRGPPALKLRYTQIPVVDQETCTNSMSWISNNMFCAGVPEGGKDACAGDGGGPYALRDDGQFWAAGIVSAGGGCGKQGKYTVYTRVANYIDWIKKTMQEN